MGGGNFNCSLDKIKDYVLANPINLLNKIKEVDGSGSGLDADTLDGKHSHDFPIIIKDYIQPTSKSYVLLGKLKVSDTSAYDSFIINGSIGAFWGPKRIININITNRQGLGYCGFISKQFKTDFDIGVNNALEVFIIFKVPGHYSFNLELFSHQSIINYKNNVTPTDTNFILLSESNDVNIFDNGSFLGSADKLTTNQLTNEDLNDIKDNEFSNYYGVWENTCINKPENALGFSLQVFKASSDCLVQLLYDINSHAFYIRTHNISQQYWGGWRKIITEDNLNKLNITLLTNHNLNSIKTIGIKYFFTHGGNSCTNKPNDMDGFMLEQVFKSNYFGYQIITNEDTGDTYKRICKGTDWQPWIKLSTVNDPAPKLTINQLTNEDLNDIKDENFSVYYAYGGNTCINTPDGVLGFNLIVKKAGAFPFVQILDSVEIGTYRRFFTNNAWSPWKKMLTEDDIAPIITRIESLEAKLT